MRRRAKESGLYHVMVRSCQGTVRSRGWLGPVWMDLTVFEAKWLLCRASVEVLCSLHCRSRPFPALSKLPIRKEMHQNRPEVGGNLKAGLLTRAPQSYPHALYMRLTSYLLGMGLRFTCVLHASLMRPSCVLHASYMRGTCVPRAGSEQVEALKG